MTKQLVVTNALINVHALAFVQFWKKGTEVLKAS